MSVTFTFAPLREPAIMTDETGTGIRVSTSVITIILFLFAQTIGGVWWASAINEKMNVVSLQRLSYETDLKELRQKIETLIQGGNGADGVLIRLDRLESTMKDLQKSQKQNGK